MGFDLSGKRVAVLGAGKMGGILLKALLEKGLLSPKRPSPPSSMKNGRGRWRKSWASRSAPTIWRRSATPTSSSFA